MFKEKTKEKIDSMVDKLAKLEREFKAFEVTYDFKLNDIIKGWDKWSAGVTDRLNELNQIRLKEDAKWQQKQVEAREKAHHELMEHSRLMEKFAEGIHESLRILREKV